MAPVTFEPSATHEIEDSNHVDQGEWCDVVTRRRKQKSADKNKNAPWRQTRNGGLDTECPKQVQSANKKDGVSTVLAQDDMVSRHLKDNTDDTQTGTRHLKENTENTQYGTPETSHQPLPPPWRNKPRQIRQSAPQQEARKDGFDTLRADWTPDTTPGSRHSGDSNASAASKIDSSEDRFEALRPHAGSHARVVTRQKSDSFGSEDRFEALRSQPTPESTPKNGWRKDSSTISATRGMIGTVRLARHSDHTDDVTAPADKEKLKAKQDIQAEIGACLVGSSLQFSDFDMRARQYVHAIYQKGGRPQLHDALQILHASTCQKSRETVRSWPAYVLTILRKFFNDKCSASLGEAPACVSPQACLKLVPNAPLSPDTLCKFAPPLRSGDEP